MGSRSTSSIGRKSPRRKFRAKEERRVFEVRQAGFFQPKETLSFTSTELALIASGKHEWVMTRASNKFAGMRHRIAKQGSSGRIVEDIIGHQSSRGRRSNLSPWKPRCPVVVAWANFVSAPKGPREGCATDSRPTLGRTPIYVTSVKRVKCCARAIGPDRGAGKASFHHSARTSAIWNAANVRPSHSWTRTRARTRWPYVARAGFRGSPAMLPSRMRQDLLRRCGSQVDLQVSQTSLS